MREAAIVWPQARPTDPRTFHKPGQWHAALQLAPAIARLSELHEWLFRLRRSARFLWAAGGLKWFSSSSTSLLAISDGQLNVQRNSLEFPGPDQRGDSKLDLAIVWVSASRFCTPCLLRAIRAVPSALRWWAPQA